jgi:hypothetical protein
MFDCCFRGWEKKEEMKEDGEKKPGEVVNSG